MTLTTHAGVEDRAGALVANVHIHMTGPVDPGELVAAIAKLIKRDAE